MRTIHWAFPVLLFLSGCASVATTPRPDSYYAGVSQADDAKPLFRSDATGLTDADIERILSYRLALPKQNRIAILSLSGASYWRFYSNDFVQLNEAIEKEFVGTLKGSGRVYDASFLPALLVPENRTVPYLREAAARYQSDLLLAYRTRCASYEKFRLFSATETRAYCSVEAVLLDTRTGIVPFTVVSTNNVETTKGADDKSLAETTKKNELAAIGKSLNEIARGLVQFLDKTPARQ
jgi:hypothetical protein